MCEGYIDSPCSKLCEGESIFLRQGVSGRTRALKLMAAHSFAFLYEVMTPFNCDWDRR